MTKVEVKPGIFWVGVIDWAVRDFHGYVTPQGTTYNNYLIMDEEITLVDAVHQAFVGLSIDSIRTHTDPANIKNIIVNHIEPDHAGGLLQMINLAPDAQIYCTKKAEQGPDRMFDISKWNINIVKSGDELNIGKKTLLFLETPLPLPPSA